jgi:hypothetical protein
MFPTALHYRRHLWLPASVGAGLLMLAACFAPSSRPAVLPNQPDTSAPNRVYIIRRGWHTDVAFDIGQLRGPLAGLQSDFPGAAFLVFGFGDRHYLANRRRSFSAMLAAVFPGDGIILVTGLRVAPAGAFGKDNVLSFDLRQPPADRIIDFVAKSIRTDAAGNAHPYAPGPYGGSLFYLSPLAYHGFHTCNTWTAEALQHGGLPVSATGVIFAGQVWRQLLKLQPGTTFPLQDKAAPAAP